MTRSVFRHLLLAATVLACVGVMTTPAAAAQSVAYEQTDTPSAAAMGVDLLLVRPLGLVSTVAGTGLFVLSLPFTLLGGNVEEAAHVLVAEPGAYTFSRPLGEFE